ncbi:hypothetical protein [Caenibacillus caldisaponilyticus]|uniref:hypothetical protein n=1 Tax=Caenibacillus caldisaponilyticus TaxID=1674942 RepID=UPI0011789DC8|nr:hypothetical protein [Caenibacillus caldisaponilyticus]
MAFPLSLFVNLITRHPGSRKEKLAKVNPARIAPLMSKIRHLSDPVFPKGREGGRVWTITFAIAVGRKTW